MTAKKSAAKKTPRKTPTKHASSSGAKERLYTLEVFLISGPITEKFASRYVMASAFDLDDGGRRPTGRTDQTTIESLRLRVDQPFGYWFDFGDDWWHQINVEAIDDARPAGKYPKVIKKTGQSPPQLRQRRVGTPQPENTKRNGDRASADWADFRR
jgi:hypothetical protein